MRGTNLRTVALGASLAVIIAILALELASASVGQTIPKPPYYQTTTSTPSPYYSSTTQSPTPKAKSGAAATTATSTTSSLAKERGVAKAPHVEKKRKHGAKPQPSAKQAPPRAPAPRPAPPKPRGPNPDRDRAIKEMNDAYNALREAAKLVSEVKGEEGKYLAKLLDTAIGLYKQSIDLFKRGLFSLSAAYAHAAKEIADEVLHLSRAPPSPPHPHPPPPPPPP